MIRSPVCLWLVALAAPAEAQIVRTSEPGVAAPAASIDRLGWLAGSWSGEAFGGEVSETYSPIQGGRITGHFVASSGSAITFTEIVDYVPVGRSLAYRVRHFGPDMKGWEDGDGKPVVFPLVAVEGSRWYFDGMTLDRTGADTLTMWVRIERDGKVEDVPFRLARTRR